MAITKADELVRIVSDTLKWYEQRLMVLEDEVRELREDARTKVEVEILDENRRLKDKLEFSIDFLNTKKEMSAYQKFRDEHAKRCRSTPYTTARWNGIGVEHTVVCPVCGEKEDITDIDGW